MKKFLFAMVTFVIAATLTACGSDNGKNDKENDISTTYSDLAMTAKTCMNGHLVYDYDFTATLTAHYGTKTLTLALNNVKFAEKMPAVDFVIDGINFSEENGLIKVEASSVSASAGYTVTGMKGYFDTEHKVYSISFAVNGTYEVLLSSHFNCSDNHYASSNQRSYSFLTTNEDGKQKLRMGIHNVKFVEAMPILKEMAVYITNEDGCTLKSTATGYEFECETITPYYKEGATETPMVTRQMTNVKGNIDLVNRKFSVEFDCYGTHDTYSGTLYI